MHPDEAGCGAAHRVRVEVVLDPPDERLRERRAAPRDLVDVAARHRVVPRMKAVPHLVDAQDVDVGRQRVVDRAACSVSAGSVGVDVEVRDLGERVDAGVGPA